MAEWNDNKLTSESKDAVGELFTDPDPKNVSELAKLTKIFTDFVKEAGSHSQWQHQDKYIEIVKKEDTKASVVVTESKVLELNAADASVISRTILSVCFAYSLITERFMAKHRNDSPRDPEISKFSLDKKKITTYLSEMKLPRPFMDSITEENSSIDRLTRSMNELKVNLVGKNGKGGLFKKAVAIEVKKASDAKGSALIADEQKAVTEVVRNKVIAPFNYPGRFKLLLEQKYALSSDYETTTFLFDFISSHLPDLELKTIGDFEPFLIACRQGLVLFDSDRAAAHKAKHARIFQKLIALMDGVDGGEAGVDQQTLDQAIELLENNSFAAVTDGQDESILKVFKPLAVMDKRFELPS